MEQATARPTLRPSVSQLLGPIRRRRRFKGTLPWAIGLLPGQDGGLWPDDLSVHVAIPVHVVEDIAFPDAMVQLPDGVELTLSELQDMASRQQQQIESHQQMLVAKEQRLKFLKQQELQHQQMTSENERLRRLRERVEAQELKLRKLRALRGQVDQQKMSNSSLTSELESIRALFNEKEKELSVAVAKVEELTQQLEEVRRGRLSNQVLGGSSSPAMLELEKLRRELLYRNKLNEQQNNKLAQQREALSRGQEEMNRIDRRISELQQRLHRKRMHNQQLSNQINAVTSAKQAQLRSNQSRNRTRPLSANIAAVEPFKHVPNDVSGQPATTTAKVGVQPERAQDDLHPKLSSAKTEDLPEFQPNKNDPKYQTLPVNTKFLVKLPKPSDGEDAKPGSGGVSGSDVKKNDDKATAPIVNSTPGGGSTVNGKMPPATQTVHSIPTYTPPKGHAMPVAHQLASHPPSQPLPQLMPTKTNISAKPFSTTYSSSIIISSIASTGPSAPKYIPPPAPPPSSSDIPVLRPSSNLPNTPLTAPTVEKPISSVAPTTLQQSRIPLAVATSAPHARPSPIYQTSSTRVTPITPHTLSATPQGLLRDLTEDSSAAPPQSKFAISVPVSRNQTANDAVTETVLHSASENFADDGDSGDTPGSPAKPTLPPKPSIPQKPTPPPRQIHSHGGTEKGKVDTSPGAVDSALNILRGSQGSKGSGNYRYASRNVITDTYTQKLSSNSLNQYLRNMTHTFGRSDGESTVPQNNATVVADPDPVTEEPTSVSSTDGGGDSENNAKKSLTSNDLPIKPKPLTIKKNSGVEPPKLKVLTNGSSGPGSPRKQSPPLEANGPNNSTANNNVSNVSCNNGGNLGNNRAVHISINKRIEMPPAFLFPENETPPPDLNVSRDSHTVVNVNSSSDVKSDVPDNVVKIPPPPPLGPPPYPLVEGDKAWDAAKSWSDKKRHPLPTTDNIPADDQTSSDNVSSNHNNETESNSDFTPATTTTTTTTTTISEGDAVRNTESSTGLLTLSVHEVNEADASSSSSSPNSCSGDPQSIVTVRRGHKGNLKTKRSTKAVRRVSFDPLALLLDASLEGELELVRKTAREVPNPSAANDEGITALHNAICAGHYEIVKFLVEFGCDVNAQDSDGWTPLHCAASCNNLPMVKFLVEHGACIFATTLSDHETAAEKCEEDEEGFDGCSEYLYSIQEKLGILNNGAVYALYDYEAHNSDELSFSNGDMIVVLRKGDEFEREWWWSRFKNQEGYIPRNLLGLYPRVSCKDA